MLDEFAKKELIGKKQEADCRTHTFKHGNYRISGTCKHVGTLYFGLGLNLRDSRTRRNPQNLVQINSCVDNRGTYELIMLLCLQEQKRQHFTHKK